MTNKNLRIAFSGGGSAGHLYPVLAVAKKIQERATKQPIEFYFIGPETIGSEALTQAGVVYKKILAGKLRRYFSLTNFLDLFVILPVSLFQCLWIMFRIMPDVLFCKGGFGGLPAALVAWLYRIPVIVHDSDSYPGLSNKIAAKFAKKIAVSFPEAKSFFPPEKTALTGNPLREDLLGGTPDEAKRILDLQGDKPVLFVVGGSQGAEAINTILFAILTKLLPEIEIIHQCGINNIENIKQQLPQTIPPDSILNGYYHFFGFLNTEQMKQAYGVATLVLSRAGATSINELANLGKPGILIPLPENAGNQHQIKNAFSYAKSGAAVVLEQGNLTPNILAARILELIKNKELLEKMTQGAKNFAIPNASDKLAEETLRLANL